MWLLAERMFFLFSVILSCCFLKTFEENSTNDDSSSTPPSTPFNQVNTTTVVANTESHHNNTVVSDVLIPGDYVFGHGRNGGGAALRAFYVLMGLTLIVIVYFGIRSVRLRRKRSKSHKYGVIARNGDLEMTPLDQDDEDETTVFEATNHSRN